MKHDPVVRIVTATEAKSNFGEIIKRAYASDEHLIVERGGIPVVAIIPISVYQKNVGTPADATPEVAQRVATASERADASRRLGELLEKVHAQMPKVDEAEAEKLINPEVNKVRAAHAKRMLAAERKTRSTRARPLHRVRA